MRYLSLAEAIVIAERVTGIEARTLVKASRMELLDSALHAPQAGFGEVELYPTFVEKAAVLCARIALNPRCPDGNKRLAWASLVTFCELNGHVLHVPVDDAVATMFSVAAAETNEAALADWLRSRISTGDAG